MQITADDVFMLGFWTAFYSLLLIPILVLMTIVIPRSLIKRYWKAPYFQNWELMVFSRFPQMLVRTWMLMTATCLKYARKTRQLDDYLDHVPTWFRVVSTVIVFFVFLSLFIILGSFFGLGIYHWVVTGTLMWELVLVIASLALIVGVIIYSRSKHYQERHKRNNRKL